MKIIKHDNKIKEYLNKLKGIHVHGLEDNIVKIAILPKLTHRFNVILIRIPPTFLAKIDRLILKFIWKCKGLRITQTMLNKNKVGSLRLSGFKTYFRATLIKTVWDKHNDGHTNQWNRIENSKISPYQFTFDKDAKTIQWEKSSLTLTGYRIWVSGN